MTVPDDDPLAALFTDADALDLKRIAAALAPYVSIDSKTGRLHHKDDFATLAHRAKILIALLARKVAVLRDAATAEGMSPDDLSSETGVALQSVRARVSDLVNDRLVARDDSKLSIPPAHVTRVLAEIEGANKGQRSARSAQGAQRSRGRRGKAVAQDPNAAVDGSGPTTDRNTSKKVSASAVGPAQLVRDLIDQGFFDTRRTLSDVQEHLRHKRGHHFKVTTLSPAFTRLLRSGQLDRDRNEAGMYEYFVPGKG